MSNFLESEEYKRRVDEIHTKMMKEYEVVEEASWFGKTGLDEATERELPHYIRREYGESVFDEDSLRADELEYLGVYETDAGPTRFWKIPTSDARPVYAYAMPYEDSVCLGLGDKSPPK